MRVSLFGGSFDPPHLGHIAIALAAARTFAVDRVLFAPVGRQPLKRDALIASYTDRLAMVDLVCAEHPDLLAASELDHPRPDGLPNYSVDTLSQLRRAYPSAEIFSLIGADAFADIARWRDPKTLLSLAQWIVVTRPGATLASLSPLPEAKGRIHLLDTVHLDISATEVRRRLAAGLPCDDLVPAPVLRYIEQHDLYRSAPPLA
jgi:nicotinate-nucleotide adenylyltransferase